MNTDTWNWTMLAAIAQSFGALVTAYLAIATYRAASAAMLSAKTAEREFRATRRPILSLEWKGPNGVVESSIYSGCIKSSSPVVIEPITVGAVALSGTYYKIFLANPGTYHAKHLKADEEFRFTITVTATDTPVVHGTATRITVTAPISIPGIEEEVEKWYCESSLQLLPGPGGPMLVMSVGQFQRCPVVRQSNLRLVVWVRSAAERRRKRRVNKRRVNRSNPLNLSY